MGRSLSLLPTAGSTFFVKEKKRARKTGRFCGKMTTPPFGHLLLINKISSYWPDKESFGKLVLFFEMNG
jgi:hypothetical protein